MKSCDIPKYRENKIYMAIIYYLKLKNCVNTIIVGSSGEKHYLIVCLDLEEQSRIKLT